jgi:DNA-binding response OmpR family regulator
MTSILLVEDDQDLQLVLQLGLEENGFRVTANGNGSEALETVQSLLPDLVLIDVNLGPKSIDGFELCRRLRTTSSVPIIFLTVRGEDVDHLVGLALGANDYLVKPISMRILSARIHLALERSGSPVMTRDALIDRDLRINTESRQVTVGDSPVNLTRIEFDILAALAASPERVLSREEITAQVWGSWYGSDAHLDVHMCRLRKKVMDAGGPRVGESVRGIGFKLR